MADIRELGEQHAPDLIDKTTCGTCYRFGGGAVARAVWPCETVRLRERIAASEARVAALEAALESSEEYRRAYQAGKYKLYSELDDANRRIALRHLPGGEGALDRASRTLLATPGTGDREGKTDV